MQVRIFHGGGGLSTIGVSRLLGEALSLFDCACTKRVLGSRNIGYFQNVGNVVFVIGDILDFCSYISRVITHQR